MTVDGKLARLAADLDDAFSEILDRHLADEESSLRHHTPFGLYLTTVDGIAATFLEEGIEFYPKNKIVAEDAS